MVTIALFHGRGIISSLIRWQTRGKYSHAALVVGTRPLTIIEAWQGVGVRKKVLWNIEGVDFFRVKILSLNLEACFKFAHDQIGHKYDYIGVMRFIDRRPGGSPTRWFCSELVHEAIKQGGVELLHHNSAEVAPEHLSWSPLLEPLNLKIDPYGSVKEETLKEATQAS